MSALLVVSLPSTSISLNASTNPKKMSLRHHCNGEEQEWFEKRRYYTPTINLVQSLSKKKDEFSVVEINFSTDMVARAFKKTCLSNYSCLVKSP